MYNLKKCLVKLSTVLLLSIASIANATVISTEIMGGESIWLAGRTDLTIPAAGVLWPGGLARHPVTPELIQETLPDSFAVTGGDVVRVLDPASGGISFFNGFGGTIYGPAGNGLPGDSTINAFGGISGYIGTQGALVGLFLDDAIPDGTTLPPPSLDFSTSGIGIEFSNLLPSLGQVFYIGDGVTASNDFQTFVAPTGATRFFLGVTDGFNFIGDPGAYDDNDGSYRVTLGINAIPTNISEPAVLSLLGLGLVLAFRRSKKI